MIDLLRQNSDSIAEVCQSYGVQRLEVFGSAARGDFRLGESDVDFVVEFEPSARGRGLLTRYLEFAEALEKILGTEVEILTCNSLQNPYLRHSVEACKESVYAA